MACPNFKYGPKYGLGPLGVKKKKEKEKKGYSGPIQVSTCGWRVTTGRWPATGRHLDRAKLPL
jgi:hypothetical protein